MIRLLLALCLLAGCARAQLQSFCQGDTTCPCGSNGLDPSIPAGCPNSVSGWGSWMEIYSNTWEWADWMDVYEGIVLVHRLPPNAVVVICQGTTTHAPAVFGDGLRCVGGSLVRIATIQATLAYNDWGVRYPNAGQPTLAERGGVPMFGGGYRAYFALYRNAASFCTPATFNTTNAWGIMWV